MFVRFHPSAQLFTHSGPTAERLFGFGVSRELWVNKMKNYYAKHKGKCFAFQDRKLLSCALNTYGFEPIKQAEALRQFGYTDSASRYVIDYQAISSEEELRSLVMQYAEKITVKRATVEAFLDAAKEHASFSKNTVIETGTNYVELLKQLEELKDAEKLKAQKLFKEAAKESLGPLLCR